MPLVNFGPKKILTRSLLLLNSTNHLRRMEETLQYKEFTQCVRLSPTSTRNHNSYGIEADYALTIKLDQSDGAAHTAAGDGFNAGYMVERIRGIAPEDVVQEGLKLANDRHH